MADDAVASFEYLVNAVPGLMTQLEDIVKTCKDGQKGIQSEHQLIGESDAVIKKVSGSTLHQSRLSRNAQPDVSVSRQIQPVAGQEQDHTLTEADALRLAQRKRKTASACSTRQTAPTKYRSRNMVVLYYDGELQKRFETAVRSIGACRNSMRKGKMGAKVDALSPSGSSGGDDSADEEMMSTRKPSAYPMKLRSSAKKNDGAQAFDEADSFLDKAQSLCERAAYQVLRDGECALEINKAKEHIVDARKIGDTELPGLRKKAEKAAERRRLSEEGKKGESVDNEKQSDLTEKVAPDDPLGSPASIELEVDELEVDHSEGEFDEGDSKPIIETLQLGKFPMRRSGRLGPSRFAT